MKNYLALALTLSLIIILVCVTKPDFTLLINLLCTAVDIWSVGCIMAELISGRPLFPGTDRILEWLFSGYSLDKTVVITLQHDLYIVWKSNVP